MIESKKNISLYGARVHNLKNIDLQIPRDRLVVITGLSGSGKSSLAFDTIYAEGQRRYIETFSAYARQFLGTLERPDVDKIEGLSPVIAIEQKTTSKNPRSTVGTVTEVYDFLRLLYARASDAYSYKTSKKMVQYTDAQIIEHIVSKFKGKKIRILAPLVQARKGHYRELLEQVLKQGFLKVRIDGVVVDLTANQKLDRYKTHDIEIVVDQVITSEKEEDIKRLHQSISVAMQQGKETLMILDVDNDQVYYYSRNLMCPDTGISYPLPEPNSFSFNSPKGACPVCKGLGVSYRINLDKVIPDRKKNIRNGGIIPLGAYKSNWVFQQIEIIGKKYHFTLETPISDIPNEALQAILYGINERFETNSKLLGVRKQYELRFEGVVGFLEHQLKSNDNNMLMRWAKDFMDEEICSNCQGSRLRKESLYFKIDKKNIGQAGQMDLISLQNWIRSLPKKLNKKQNIIASEILKEVDTRLSFLIDVGLDYLTLNRSSASLSGGEAQRIRLATQIGSQLVNVLYILDEPSIGLHQSDNIRLIDSLKKLRDLGNSILVVEHDMDMILQADHVIDMGPRAGVDGGYVVAQGTPKQIIQSQSLTADYLNGIKDIKVPKKRRAINQNKELILHKASGNNLKNINIRLPLGCFIGVSGVSGSGKSTLINETLQPILSQHFYQSVKKPLPYEKIEGLDLIDKVISIDQSPIGRTPRSNPATYTGVFSDIRTLFTQVPEAKLRGYKAGRFSFNVKGGRCENCQGAGYKVIEMHLLPDVTVPCESCHGQRFNRETLEIRYKGKSISEVLDMTITEATSFFSALPNIYRYLETLMQVGLGYIKLGQASTTLSGGEAQRIKLAAELSKKNTGNTLFILDEPTTGLHFEDVSILIDLLQQLVNKGNTVLVIEHNLDVLKCVDYLIDIGPEAGVKGGQIIAQGTPEEVAKSKHSKTAPFLEKVLMPYKKK